jgi:hypothetical protein
VSKWWFSFAGRWFSKDATTTSAAPRRAKSNREICAEKKLALAVSNNAGIENRENIFRINGLLPLVRSEGGRICCDINGLHETVKA